MTSRDRYESSEKGRARHQKYNASEKGRERNRNREKTHNRKEYKREQRFSREHQRKRPFVGWDGEGCKDSGYSLFGCSDGLKIRGWNLPTSDLLNLMLAAEQQNPDAIHIGFSFEYDVNMILKDLEPRYLAMLNENTRVNWNGYHIEHVPKKWFSVSKDGTNIKIFDVFGFFNCRYDDALKKYKVGNKETVDEISAGKDKREDFYFADLDYIESYWEKEILLLPQMMEVVRDALYDAGFYITYWHGPSAVASYALRQNSAKDHMETTPEAVQAATRYAFAGGRFETVKAGYRDGGVYTADINSAYTMAIAQLPSLAGKSWKHIIWESGMKVEKFGLYFVKFHSKDDKKSASERMLLETSGKVYPFFRRMSDGTICWPKHVENWYFTPEAQLVEDELDAEISEAWILEDDTDRPFAWVGELYERRLRLQRMGHQSEKAYKWLLASIYGQFARRTGWKKYDGPPPSHQLEWAGFVTSWCRAAIYRAAKDVWERGHAIISIDTDGITSAIPFRHEALSGGVGDKLGEWKLETYDGTFVWENGLYWLRRDGVWESPKTRGIPRRQVKFDKAWNAWKDGDYFKVTRNTFIGYKRGLRGQMDIWRTWQVREYGYAFGGKGKRYHNTKLCAQCARPRPDEFNFYGMCPLYDGSILKVLARGGYEAYEENPYGSKPHVLPWLEARDEEYDDIFRD